MASRLLTGLAPALTAAAILGAVSTLGDWIWQRYIPDGAVVPGLAHGVLFFLVMAAVLARVSNPAVAMGRLMATLPPAGLLIAASFYPLAGFAGYLGALLITWVLMWLSLALLHRWARRGQEPLSVPLIRGGLAALGSGLAFWTVSGLWTEPPLETGYLVRFLFWTFAFLPGFLALLFEPRSSGE